MIVSKEKCYICGHNGIFTTDDNVVSYREATCANCGASIRNSDVGKIIVSTLLREDISLTEAIPGLRNHKILYTAASGSIHSVLKQLPGYFCGEYFDNVSSGEYVDGIMSVDLKVSPFVDNFFDLIISEDVLVYIDNVNMAFREVNRILKTQGIHIFSVPFHHNKRTQDRTYMHNKIYGNPYRQQERLVYTDFGENIEDIVNEFGMYTEKFILHQFYDFDHITNVDLDYEKYLANKQTPLQYFKYNSVVFCSRKIKSLFNSLIYKPDKGKGLDFTGERFIPEKVSGEITAEHLHRYSAILKLVKDKVVVDAACGEGYGSYILAETAKQVFGVDIDQAAILFAQGKYLSNNIEYLNSSIQKLPFETNSIDVVVSFETIEHVDKKIQRNFLDEIKRILKKDGILIISTPDKASYSDKFNFKNEYHIKEFYFTEFRSFLKCWFNDIKIYNQGFEVLSLINAAEQTENTFTLLRQPENWKINKKYMIAVCGKQELANSHVLQSIMYQEDISLERDRLQIDEMGKTINYLEKRIKHQKELLRNYMMNLVEGKKIVFFGTGSAIDKIYTVFTFKPEYYIDNNSEKWNMELDGRKIYNPNYLLQEDKKNIAIIIASQFYQEIAAQLQELGFLENRHYWNGADIVDL